MRPVTRYVTLALIVAALFSGQQPALACSCAQRTKPEPARSAAVVFTGVVRSFQWIYGLRSACTPSSGDRVNVVIDVERTYRGDLPREITVTTVRGGASCGYEFTEGKRYTVFARRVDGALETGLCSGNVAGVIDPAEYGLGPGSTP